MIGRSTDRASPPRNDRKLTVKQQREAARARRKFETGASLKSLERARDTAAVRVEIRAAELASLATSQAWCKILDEASPAEAIGWFDWSRDRLCVSVPRDEWDAGWLGRIIYEHGRSSS